MGTGDGIAISVVEHYAVSPAAIPALSNSKPDARPSFADFNRAVNRSGFSYKAIHDARNKVRTAPLWGLRTHSRLMHDGDSVQLIDAIKRHSGEASAVARRFLLLTPKGETELAGLSGFFIGRRTDLNAPLPNRWRSAGLRQQPTGENSTAALEISISLPRPD